MVYSEFMESLSPSFKKQVEKGVNKLYENKFGNCKRLRPCCMSLNKHILLYECRIDIGPGYRIYYTIYNHGIKILGAGAKKSQMRDINLIMNLLEKGLI